MKHMYFSEYDDEYIQFHFGDQQHLQNVFSDTLRCGIGKYIFTGCKFCIRFWKTKLLENRKRGPTLPFRFGTLNDGHAM